MEDLNLLWNYQKPLVVITLGTIKVPFGATATDRADGLVISQTTPNSSQDHLRCLIKAFRSSTATGWKRSVGFSMMGRDTGVRHAGGVGLFHGTNHDVECVRNCMAAVAILQSKGFATTTQQTGLRQG